MLAPADVLDVPVAVGELLHPLRREIISELEPVVHHTCHRGLGQHVFCRSFVFQVNIENKWGGRLGEGTGGHRQIATRLCLCGVLSSPSPTA